MQAYWNPAIMPPLRWSQAIGINLTYYYLWTVTTPLVVTMARRFRFESGRWHIAFIAHALASACAMNAMFHRPLSKRKRRAIITTSGVVTAQR